MAFINHYPASQHSAYAFFRVVYGDTLTHRRVEHILTTPNTINDILDSEKIIDAM